MGPNPNGPRSVSCDRAIRYSGLGVRSLGPVGDFLDLGSVCFVAILSMYSVHVMTGSDVFGLSWSVIYSPKDAIRLWKWSWNIMEPKILNTLRFISVIGHPLLILWQGDYDTYSGLQALLFYIDPRWVDIVIQRSLSMEIGWFYQHSSWKMDGLETILFFLLGVSAYSQGIASWLLMEGIWNFFFWNPLLGASIWCQHRLLGTSTCPHGTIPLHILPVYTVDGRNPAHQLRLVVYPAIYRVFYIPGGAGFLPSTVVENGRFNWSKLMLFKTCE